MVFNEMLRETDFLRMSAFTMGVSTLDYNQTAATPNTNGLLFKLYGEHLDTRLHPGLADRKLSAASSRAADRWRSAADQRRQPHLSAGHGGSLNADHRFLTLAVVNATDSEQKFDLTVSGSRLTGSATVWQMTGNTLDAVNHVGQTPQVEIKESRIAEVSPTLSVPPISVMIFQFSVVQAAQ